MKTESALEKAIHDGVGTVENILQGDLSASAVAIRSVIDWLRERANASAARFDDDAAAPKVVKSQPADGAPKKKRGRPAKVDPAAPPVDTKTVDIETRLPPPVDPNKGREDAPTMAQLERDAAGVQPNGRPL